MSKHISNTNLETILPPLVHLASKPADWDENDPSESGYIANRPFYETKKKVDIIPRTVFNAIVNEGNEIFAVIEGAINPIIQGQKYHVEFDGSTYVCTGLDDPRVLGNYEMVGGPTSDDVPFFIGDNLDGTLYIAIDSTGDHDIYVYTYNIDIKKIDSKYLPDINLPEGAYIGEKGSADGAEIFNGATFNSAYGPYSHAEGFQTYTGGSFSHAEGQSTEAHGVASHAEGCETSASGDYSHANGYKTVASGRCSYAEGYSTQAANTGVNNTSININQIEYGLAAHAEGANTVAYGSCSHAEGDGTRASGYTSHSEGNGSIASGKATHAEGRDTKATGSYSHAEGNSNIASGDSQHVQGKFNLADSNYAHIVGNGTSNSARSNAHTLDWSGNAWFQGTVEGTALILKSSTSGSTKRFKITVNDSGTISATQI